MRFTCLVASVVFAALPLVSCGEPSSSAPVGGIQPMASSADGLGPIEWRDRLYFKQITANDINEIELAKIALARSQNVVVRGFAQKMVQDHTKMHQEAAKLVGNNGMQLAQSMDAVGKVQQAVLTRQPDSDFDKAYMTGQVEAHDMTLSVLSQTVKHASDPGLIALAAQSIPTISGHMAEAKAILEGLP